MTTNLRDIIGTALIAAFIAALAVLFWKAIPTENEQLIVYMLGQLSGFVAGVVAFHYVQKAGEKELDAQRAENTQAAFRAIEAASLSSPPPAHDVAAKAADQVADAAEQEAEAIKGADHKEEDSKDA